MDKDLVNNSEFDSTEVRAVTPVSWTRPGKDGRCIATDLERAESRVCNQIADL